MNSQFFIPTSNFLIHGKATNDASLSIGTQRPHATFIHRHSSGIVGRLPYERMPTRKIFAVAQKKAAIVTRETRIETAMCQSGGSETSVRTNIVIGPKTGA